jgi:hypothetical protein
MENQNSLSAYMVTDKTPIFLENTQMGQKLPSEAAENLEFQTTLDVSSQLLLTLLTGSETTYARTPSPAQSEIPVAPGHRTTKNRRHEHPKQ